MKLRFIKEEIEGSLQNKLLDLDSNGYVIKYNVISFIFNELEIDIVLIGTKSNSNMELPRTYRDLIRIKPRDGIHYPLELFIENKNYDSEEYCKEAQEIIDNNTETILKGLVSYHKGKVSSAYNYFIVKQEELNDAQKGYDKLLEYYSRELLFV